MKVSELVKTCGEILNLGFPDEYFIGSLAPNDSNASKLTSCCNFVLEELYRDYTSSLSKTVVEAINGFVDLSNFSICKVISLVDSEGNSTHYRYAEGGLLVAKDGKYNLCYAKLSPTLGWDDEIKLPTFRVTHRILIYGVLREYCLQIGDWSNASAWDSRYKDALRVASVKRSVLRIPARRWV